MRVTLRPDARITYSGQWPHGFVGNPVPLEGFIARNGPARPLLSTASYGAPLIGMPAAFTTAALSAISCLSCRL